MSKFVYIWNLTDLNFQSFERPFAGMNIFGLCPLCGMRYNTTDYQLRCALSQQSSS